jgi:hypothetical protein
MASLEKQEVFKRHTDTSQNSGSDHVSGLFVSSPITLCMSNLLDESDSSQRTNGEWNAATLFQSALHSGEIVL